MPEASFTGRGGRESRLGCCSFSRLTRGEKKEDKLEYILYTIIYYIYIINRDYGRLIKEEGNR